uniref:Uncharacterized protein n=1 Tax=Noctiluca scintillans TaxID=2966 RepID=A0A7S0ZZG5_NOCSC|mmetsp:Transcript_2557/g.7606  ORF Transcript_2557/g.7606 Transcript_2557/m.7606 type:complete len:135 (+) Transcript_2557:14-418(+)
MGVQTEVCPHGMSYCMASCPNPAHWSFRGWASTWSGKKSTAESCTPDPSHLMPQPLCSLEQCVFANLAHPLDHEEPRGPRKRQWGKAETKVHLGWAGSKNLRAALVESLVLSDLEQAPELLLLPQRGHVVRPTE